MSNSIQYTGDQKTSDVEHERPTAERMGQLFTAVGNHEAKALTLSAMEIGVPYGTTALHRQFLDIQGDHPAYEGATTNQIDYCKDSFEAVGAVAKARWGETLRYELTEEGETFGKALSGHLLDLSSRYPDIALRQLFGMTKTSGDAERSPVVRLQIFDALLRREPPIRVADVERELLGVDTEHSSVSNQLAWLSRAHLINQVSAHSKTISTKIEYYIPQGETFETKTGKGKQEKITEVLRSLSANTDTVLTFEEIAGAVIAAHPEVSRAYISRLLDSFYEQGAILKNELTGMQKSILTIDPDKRAVMKEVVDVYRLALDDPETFIRLGKEKLARIISDPEVVRTLVAKAFANSPEANKVPREVRFAKIAQFIVSAERATTSEIKSGLIGEKGFTERSIEATLQQMRRDRLLQSKLAHGENIWAIAEEDEGTELH
jgi:Fe2+ or Zn2+ uptake regulation protein